jgi:hypothetical protein
MGVFQQLVNPSGIWGAACKGTPHKCTSGLNTKCRKFLSYGGRKERVREFKSKGNLLLSFFKRYTTNILLVYTFVTSVHELLMPSA